MKRDDNLYKYGIIIEYNTNPVIKGNGSAIFMHIWKGENVPTAGLWQCPKKTFLKSLTGLIQRHHRLLLQASEIRRRLLL